MVRSEIRRPVLNFEDQDQGAIRMPTSFKLEFQNSELVFESLTSPFNPSHIINFHNQFDVDQSSLAISFLIP
jgi:hypothetical protein